MTLYPALCEDSATLLSSSCPELTPATANTHSTCNCSQVSVRIHVASYAFHFAILRIVKSKMSRFTHFGFGL